MSRFDNFEFNTINYKALFEEDDVSGKSFTEDELTLLKLYKDDYIKLKTELDDFIEALKHSFNKIATIQKSLADLRDKTFKIKRRIRCEKS